MIGMTGTEVLLLSALPLGAAAALLVAWFRIARLRHSGTNLDREAQTLRLAKALRDMRRVPRPARVVQTRAAGLALSDPLQTRRTKPGGVALHHLPPAQASPRPAV